MGLLPSINKWRRLRRVVSAVFIATLLVITFGSIAIVVHSPPEPSPSELQAQIISLCFVAAFSGAIGFGELTERYRDDPARLFASYPTVVYISVNVAAAVGALALIEEFNVFDRSMAHRAVYQVLLASFGSIAFFRSSLFTARVGDKDVDVGPSTLLKSLLNTSDRMINRSQAKDRASDAGAIMRAVDFSRAKAALPVFCFNLVENVTDEVQARIATSITKLAAIPEAEMTNAQRSLILGTYLMKEVGPDVLRHAVDALGDSITVQNPA